MNCLFTKFHSLITANSEIIKMVFTLIGVIIAWRGINNWEKQLDGTSKIKLAKTLLSLVYKLRDNFSNARIKVFFEYEYPVEKGLSNQKIVRHIMEYRLRPINETMSIFEKEYYWAYVEWGEEVSKLITPLRELYKEYLFSVDCYIYYIDEPGTGTYKSAQSIALKMKDINDDFECKLNNIVDDFEVFLRRKYLGKLKYLIYKIKNKAKK